MESNSKKVKRVEQANKKYDEAIKKLKSNAKSDEEYNAKALEKVNKKFKDECKGL